MTQTAWTLQDRHKAFCGDRHSKSVRHTLKNVAIDHDQRLVKGIIAADVIDLEREVIIPKGLRYGPGHYFMGTTKAVYLDHSWADKNAPASERMPVAVCRRIEDQGDHLFAQTRITKLTIGDEILTLIEEEALRGLSVGVIGDDEGPPTSYELKRYGDTCQNVIRTGDMLEYSIVSMPCNPSAVLKCLTENRIRRATASIFMPGEVSTVRKSYPVSGPAKVEKTILLDRDLALIGVLG